MFSDKPILQLPDIEKSFFLSTDASTNAIGGCLMQKDSEGICHPVLYISRKLVDAETRYATVEREGLAIVWCITKLTKYLLGVPFTLYTDHAPLSFIDQKKLVNHRVARWSLILQDFRFNIVAIPGKDNVVADILSRCSS